MLETQAVEPTTLVWREGMPGWVPLAEVRPELTLATEPGASPLSARAQCVECGQMFPVTEMVHVKGMNVCAGCKPAFLQKISQGAPVGSALGLWRKGPDMVVAKDAELPSRCVKCNASAPGKRLKRNLYWHHPALYLMILFPGLLIYAIVAIAVRKRATLQVGLCEAHRSRRFKLILAAWLTFLAGIGVIFAGASLLRGDIVAIPVLTGIAMVLTGIILGVVGSRTVFPRKIDNDFAYVRGVCSAYLDELPALPDAL